jgi:hypothetical protein
MNEQQQNETQSHKDGPPWENIRVFSSFGEADACRKALLQEPSKQVKVKMQVNSQGENVFVVKQRTNPELSQNEPVKEKKKDKKKQ